MAGDIPFLTKVHTCALMHTRAQTHTQAHTHADVHMHTHIHVCPHTSTHTHTQLTSTCRRGFQMLQQVLHRMSELHSTEHLRVEGDRLG